MNKLLLLSFILLSFTPIYSQFEALELQFEDYEIVYIPSQDLMDNIQSSRSDVKTMTILDMDIQLYNSNIISPRYQSRHQTENGVKISQNKVAIPMRGTTSDGKLVSLTFNDNFVYGFIQSKEETIYIEPISHFVKGSFTDTYVRYKVSDIKEGAPKLCGVTKEHARHRELDNAARNGQRMPGGCFEVEYAIASDFQMYQAFGNNVGNVENHAIGVTNDVQTNYDNEFDDEIQFIIVDQFVSTCSTCDPWTSSTNAEALLESFRGWAPNGFGSGHDLGSLWTDRNIATPGSGSGVIGLAYVGVVCTSFRYNLLENFSSNANLKRVMVSHEIGHNFDADHDPGGGFIMSPSVNNTNSWSAASISMIESHYLSRSCLGSCSSSAPLVANFTYNLPSACAPTVVTFSNQSTGSITSYQWSFPGGNPATSNQQNPTVTYNQEGIYDVSLTVLNGSQSNNLTLSNEIEIFNAPIADFNFSLQNGNELILINNSQNATSYIWDFGDGNSSSQESPVHTYMEDDTYIITLFAINDCGQSILQSSVSIATAPMASFSGTPLTGCDTVSVQFTNSSTSNTTSFFWEFENGTPASSFATNPMSTFNTPGSHNVSLTVENAQGSDILERINYVTVFASPQPSFTATNSGPTVTFTNTSNFANGYLWNFGDGITSMLENPTHTYSSPGTYTVTLQANSSQCQPKIITQQVTVTLQPVAIFTTSNSPSGCAPLTVNYQDQSQGNPTSRNWLFEGGSPSTSTTANPAVTYSSPGTYDVRLIVTNALGSDTTLLTDYITVETVPMSIFNANISGGNTLNVTNNTVGATSYLWDFGDGNSSTLMNPTHTYTNEGTYTVRLTVTNGCGQATSTKSVNVILAPIGAIGQNSTEICTNEQVTFMDQSTNTVTNRQWIFEGGSPNTSTAMNPQINYATAGSYDVTLIVSNAVGIDTVVLADHVKVTAPPVATISQSITSNVITYSYNGQASMVTWTLPDGTTVNGNSANYTAPANGNYTVQLLVSNQCGTDTTSQTANVGAYPEANFSISDPNICQGLQASFTAIEVPQGSYSWTFDGGTPPTSNEQNPTVQYAMPGSYDVRLVVSNTLGVDTLVMNEAIQVQGLPVSSFTATYDGIRLTTSNNSSYGNTYLWSFGDGKTSTAASPSHQYATNGTYTVTLITKNECGSDTTSQIIEVEVLVPGISYTLTQRSGCAPLEVQIADQSINTPNEWQWTFPGGTPSSSTMQNPKVTYDTPGIYDIYVTMTNNAGTSTDTMLQTIEVLGPPVLNYNYTELNGTVTIESNILDADSIAWDFGNGIISNESNPSVTYQVSGLYQIVVSAFNDCGISTDSVEVEVIINSTKNANWSNNIKLYPNPTNGLLIIQGTENIGERWSLNIYDQLGQVILKHEGQKGKVLQELDLSNLTSGVYSVNIRSKNFSIAKSIIKL